jgi:hypothetical protein
MFTLMVSRLFGYSCLCVYDGDFIDFAGQTLASTSVGCLNTVLEAGSQCPFRAVFLIYKAVIHRSKGPAATFLPGTGLEIEVQSHKPRQSSGTSLERCFFENKIMQTPLKARPESFLRLRCFQENSRCAFCLTLRGPWFQTHSVTCSTVNLLLLSSKIWSYSLCC